MHAIYHHPHSRYGNEMRSIKQQHLFHLSTTSLMLFSTIEDFLLFLSLKLNSALQNV